MFTNKTKINALITYKTSYCVWNYKLFYRKLVRICLINLHKQNQKQIFVVVLD